MKKKILFALLLVAIFTCVFAISTSAAEFVSLFDEDVTTYGEGPDWADLTDKDSTVVFKIADDSFVRVPAYYVIKANGNKFVANGTTNFDFGWISEQLGQTVASTNIVALEIPEGMTSISGTFNGSNTVLSSLEELVIPTSITYLGQAMLKDNLVLKKVFVKQTINDEGKVQGVTTLPNWFLDNKVVSALESFDLQLDYLTSIGTNAFMNSSLKSFKLKAPLTSMSSTIFCNCKQLETVEIDNTSETAITFSSKGFSGCAGIKYVKLNNFALTEYLFENANGLNGGLTFIGTNITALGQQLFKNSTNLSTAIISGPITSMGGSVFLGCAYLENIEIINTLETPVKAGNNMCDKLKNLSSVKLHGVSVGAYAFREIDGDEMKVTITNCGYIGEGAFYKAANITELYIEGPFEYINKSTYRECAKLQKLTIKNTGDTYVLIGNGESNPVLEELYIEGKIDVKDTPVFQNNVSLKHVYLGEGVREIGPNAFYKCYALETMYLADTITTIGDRAIDMETASKQTSTSFMFVDENGNMDNTMPTSLTYIGGHFLKHFTIANTQIIFPESFTSHTSEQKYDFEGTKYPDGFSIVYLGKMTAVNLHKFYQHNESKNITVYLTKNSPADIKNYRVEANVGADGIISHGAYAGINPNGTLEIYVDQTLQNNIKATEYVKFVFCSSGEVCFVTRVNIPWGDSMATSWGNFVSTPVTYEQLEAAYTVYNESAEVDKIVPAKHPMVSAPEFSDATCTEPGGLKTYCLACGQIATIEKTADPLGHKLEIKDGATIVSVTYATYDASGIKVVNCATCHENCEVEAKAIFTVLGSSEKLFGDGAIAIGYEINKSAIADFEATGKTFKYGVYAVSKEKLGDNDIFGENGAFAGAMTKEITKYQNNAFELKLSGFTDAQKDKYFAMGAYVQIEAEGKSTYSYLQLGDVADGAKYSFVTYNGLTNE